MTPSAERAGIDPLPPALSSMWRLCKLGYRHEPRMMLAAFVLSQLAALPDALIALWLMLLGTGVVDHRPRLVFVAAIGLRQLRLTDAGIARDQRQSGEPTRAFADFL